MSVESEHILEAGERALIRRGLSLLVDEYEKLEKGAENKAGSEHIKAFIKAEKDDVLAFRSKFLDPGSLAEVEAAQDDLFDGDDPLETDGTPDREGESWPVDDVETTESDDTAEEPEPFEGTAAGHLDE
jgi:hypothetical protein